MTGFQNGLALSIPVTLGWRKLDEFTGTVAFWWFPCPTKKSACESLKVRQSIGGHQRWVGPRKVYSDFLAVQF